MPRADRGSVARSFTTRAKLLAGFGLASLFVFVTAGFGVLALEKLSALSQSMYVDNSAPLADLAELGTAVTTYQETLTGMTDIATQEDFLSEAKRLSPHREKVNRVLANYTAKVHHVSRSGRNEAKDLVLLKQAVERYFREAEGGLSALADSFEKSLPAARAEHLRELGVLALRVNLQKPFEQVLARHHEQVLDLQEVAKDLDEDAQTLASDAMTGLIVGGCVAAAIGLGIGYWFAYFFSKNLAHIAQVAQSAVGGNYQSRTKITSRDEFGQTAAAFNTMLDHMSASLKETEAQRAEMQKRLSLFLALVSDVGKGDLTKRGEVTADTLGNLAAGFNVMIQRFGLLMKQVREAAERVNNSAVTLKENTKQIEGSTKRQTGDPAKTLSVVDQLTESVREVSATADASSESAKQVLEATEQGCKAVQQTVQDMQNVRSTVQRVSKQVKALGDRSLEISAIVSTIHDLANQTSLLALNAGIEAAGAGGAGARFGVVADQVRKLAESSTHATREVADLAKVMQRETQDTVLSMEQDTQVVEAGSASALRAGEVFLEISEIARRSADLAQVIASAAVNQATSMDQVGRSLKDYAGSAVEAQKATDSTRATVEDMAKLAEGLTSSIAQFKVG